jgi:hypothetical protein
MKALVILDKKKASIVYTDINNIDWDDKSIINNEDIDEREFLLEDVINVYDIVLRKSIKIKVKDLSTERHQLIMNKRLFVTLHVI